MGMAASSSRSPPTARPWCGARSAPAARPPCWTSRPDATGSSTTRPRARPSRSVRLARARSSAGAAAAPGLRAARARPRRLDRDRARHRADRRAHPGGRAVKAVDLNSDLGEGAGTDLAIMPFVTSANIACGEHAGNDNTMRATVELALKHHVAIGAHPGYPDRARFGRVALEMPASELIESVRRQIDALGGIAARL